MVFFISNVIFKQGNLLLSNDVKSWILYFSVSNTAKALFTYLNHELEQYCSFPTYIVLFAYKIHFNSLVVWKIFFHKMVKFRVFWCLFPISQCTDSTDILAYVWNWRHVLWTTGRDRMGNPLSPFIVKSFMSKFEEEINKEL